MTVQEAQTDLAMVVLQKQVSASDDLLAQATVVIEAVLGRADAVARAEAALDEIKKRVALLPSFDKTVVYTDSAEDQAARDFALETAAESDNPALAARLAAAQVAVTAAETALAAAQGTDSALGALIADSYPHIRRNITRLRPDKDRLSPKRFGPCKTPAGDANVAGAFATLDAHAASTLSRIGGALDALDAVNLITPDNGVADLTALQRDLDFAGTGAGSFRNAR